MRQENPEPVRATLGYVVETGEKPINYPSEVGGRDELDVGTEDRRDVLIHNARLESPACDIDRHGFTLIGQAQPRIDLYDDAIVDSIYKPAVAALLQEYMQARRVYVFDHTRRTDDRDLRDERKIRGPASLVHNDYTPSSGIQRLRDFLPDEASRPDRGRIQIVNVWRSIGGPIERSPLALCDARTVAAQDSVPTERRARDRIGEIYRFKYNPTHKWYYYPTLSPDEAILIRTFDSASSNPMQVAPHCAFDDPMTPDSAAPRCTIELRAFVLH